MLMVIFFFTEPFIGTDIFVVRMKCLLCNNLQCACPRFAEQLSRAGRPGCIGERSHAGADPVEVVQSDPANRSVREKIKIRYMKSCFCLFDGALVYMRKSISTGTDCARVLVLHEGHAPASLGSWFGQQVPYPPTCHF